jgi:hypothetical protein
VVGVNIELGVKDRSHCVSSSWWPFDVREFGPDVNSSPVSVVQISMRRSQSGARVCWGICLQVLGDVGFVYHAGYQKME